MTFQAILTLLVIVAVFAGLQLRSAATDLVFLTALAFVTLAGIITPDQALAGFANPAVVMVGAMLVIGTGMRSTGALDWVGHQLLGQAKTDRAAADDEIVGRQHEASRTDIANRQKPDRTPAVQSTKCS